MAIPIQNVYYLLCYAWNKLEEGQIVDVSALDSTELADLFAHVLIGGTRHLLRRGLDRGYLCRSEDTAHLRGRVDMDVSVKRMLFQQSRAHCHFDELSHDVVHNRILKSVIARLACNDSVDTRLREELRGVEGHLRGIAQIELNRHVFRRVQLHRNNAFYQFLMNVCELVCDNLLVDEAAGVCRFRDFLRDDAAMARLFEAFVRNFYRIEQSEYHVTSEWINWDVECHDEASQALLPRMKTDISLRSGTRTLIVDTKYYANCLVSHRDRDILHSGHMYQILAYLRNLECRGGPDGHAEGMLLYPAVSGHLALTYRMQQHTIHVCTINLNQDWRGIREDLLGMLEAKG